MGFGDKKAVRIKTQKSKLTARGRRKIKEKQRRNGIIRGSSTKQANRVAGENVLEE